MFFLLLRCIFDKSIFKMLELIGILYKIGNVRNRNGFIFREVAFKCLDHKNVEQPVKFLLNFNDTKLVDQFQIGQRLLITYYHQGKEFENHPPDELGILDNKIITKLSEVNENKEQKKNTSKFANISFGENEEKLDLSRSYEEFPKELIY